MTTYNVPRYVPKPCSGKCEPAQGLFQWDCANDNHVYQARQGGENRKWRSK